MTNAKITLKAARVNAGLTQKEAAQSIGVSVATIKNWESGANIPAWDKVLEIEKAYKWPADSIIFLRKTLALSDLDSEPYRLQ